MADLSEGREPRVPIPVFNEVDEEGPPQLDYVADYVFAPGVEDMVCVRGTRGETTCLLVDFHPETLNPNPVPVGLHSETLNPDPVPVDLHSETLNPNPVPVGPTLCLWTYTPRPYTPTLCLCLWPPPPPPPPRPLTPTPRPCPRDLKPQPRSPAPSLAQVRVPLAREIQAMQLFVAGSADGVPAEGLLDCGIRFNTMQLKRDKATPSLPAVRGGLWRHGVLVFAVETCALCGMRVQQPSPRWFITYL